MPVVNSSPLRAVPYLNDVTEKETELKHTDPESPQDDYLFTEGSLSSESVNLSAEEVNDGVFGFIREGHLQQAWEFKLKGYNRQVPEVNAQLLLQLRDSLAAAKSRLCRQVSTGSPLGPLWILDQIGKIACFTGKLSDDVIKSWIKYQSLSSSRDEVTGTKLRTRCSAQSLVRRLESTLRTLINIVHNLCLINENSTPEQRYNLLIDELITATNAGNKRTVIQALQRMTADGSGKAAWAELINARAAAWQSAKRTMIDEMINVSRHEAEKASKKSRNLQGAAQCFFRQVAAYLQRFSSDLTKASFNIRPSTLSPVISCTKQGSTTARLPHSHSLRQQISDGMGKKKLQLQATLAGVKGHIHRLIRILPYRLSSRMLTAVPEQRVVDSIVRSILWQWQQPAIKIQCISAVLWSKVRELKKIEGVLVSYAVSDDRKSRQQCCHAAIRCPSELDMAGLVREWVSDSLEQSTPENQVANKVALLEQLLARDITRARSLVKRLGTTEENILNMLRQQRFAILKMTTGHLAEMACSMKSIDRLLPEVSRPLTASITALNKSLHAAEYASRDFFVAKKQAYCAQLLATKVKSCLSAESARLTGRAFDDYSRNSRLAKHWANLAKEHNQSRLPAPEVEQVFTALRKQGIWTGRFSARDPSGYLFATRLTCEYENACHDELRLPISPQQYSALEQGLITHIVNCAQKRSTQGITYIVIQLSFEQVLDTLSFNVGSFFRLPYKVLKAAIKIPYQVNQVSHYIMPGHDKPYKAIYGLLGKKLQQLGFDLLVTPVPGVIKCAVGNGVTLGAALHNFLIGDAEKTFSAVYQRVMEGGESKKIKMRSVKTGMFDSLLDSTVMATLKSKGSLCQWSKGENNIRPHPIFPIIYSGVSRKNILSRAEQSQIIMRENDSSGGYNTENKRATVANRHILPPPPLVDVKLCSNEPVSFSAVRTKRAVADIAAFPPAQRYRHILQSTDFVRNVHYPDFSIDQKKQTYLHGIKFVLLQIENDVHFSQKIRNDAYLARIGAKILVPVDIKGYVLNNTLFLPDSRDAKSGILIRLDSELPYYSISKGQDLLENIKWAMPYNANKQEEYMFNLHYRTYPGTANDFLYNMRLGNVNYHTYFNYRRPEPMDITSLSARLANTIEVDYQLKRQRISNDKLISRALAGAHIPDEGVSVNEDKYRLALTWDNLTPAEYLRSFSKPFSTLSGNMQLLFSFVKGETVQETEQHVHQAEYIGSWIDATAGAAISFSPAGCIFNTASATAEIVADILEDKEPDQLAIAGLVVGCVPGGRITAKVGRFTRIGGKTVKYGLLLGNKALDLAMVGKSIKTAVEAGEPLAIYQAFLTSGMSIKNSYDLAKNLSSELKITIKMEERASLEALEKLKNDTVFSSEPRLMVRSFNIGQRIMQGRIEHGDIYITRDNGLTWEKGNQLHLLAWRLQNAGGERRLPEIVKNEIVIGKYTFERIEYNQEQLSKMMKLARIYTENVNSTARMAKCQQDYQAGKAMSHTPQYDKYNRLSLDEKIYLFNQPDTDAITRGVLAGKVNEYIPRINVYEVAKVADDWRISAHKATEVILIPQNIFLKGRAGECLPESVLMGRALETGQEKKLAARLMDIYSSTHVAHHPLYKSLIALHANGNASKFSAAAIADVKLSILNEVEPILLPTENASVRVDIPEHTMLISKVVTENNVNYIFYDPNYGLAYFDKYKNMANFLKSKIEEYEIAENSVRFYHLDYSHLNEIKIAGRNLDEIINSEMTQ